MADSMFSAGDSLSISPGGGTAPGGVLVAPASNQSGNVLTGFNSALGQVGGVVNTGASIYGTLNNIINPPKNVVSAVPVVNNNYSAPAPAATGVNKEYLYIGAAVLGVIILMVAMK